MAREEDDTLPSPAAPARVVKPDDKTLAAPPRPPGLRPVFEPTPEPVAETDAEGAFASRAALAGLDIPARSDPAAGGALLRIEGA
jgi:hypothetical protein